MIIPCLFYILYLLWHWYSYTERLTVTEKATVCRAEDKVEKRTSKCFCEAKYFVSVINSLRVRAAWDADFRRKTVLKILTYFQGCMFAEVMFVFITQGLVIACAFELNYFVQDNVVFIVGVFSQISNLRGSSRGFYLMRQLDHDIIKSCMNPSRQDSSNTLVSKPTSVSDQSACYEVSRLISQSLDPSGLAR